jgi:hypothetical protein
MAQEIDLGKELLRICPTDNNKIEYSTTDGKTWHSRYKGSSAGDFYDLAVFGDEIFAVTSKGIYTSKTGGQTWHSRYIGSSYGDFETIQVNGTELVAYTSKGTYISKTKGQTWIKRN